ncbi:MAG TPA: hypothetical protein GX391_06915 [Firmicutes bacterium]|nr:hypothetical protein [Bacillota bacterium]HOQ24640.1 hypothetical protein [Bacillota bacterium]HPT68236.1 hypothetical protein [Bacillota bacterium]
MKKIKTGLHLMRGAVQSAPVKPWHKQKLLQEMDELLREVDKGGTDWLIRKLDELVQKMANVLKEQEGALRTIQREKDKIIKAIKAEKPVAKMMAKESTRRQLILPQQVNAGGNWSLLDIKCIPHVQL